MPTGFSMALDLSIQSVSTTFHFWQLYAVLMELLVSSASWIILLYYIHGSITVIEKKANCKSACDANYCVISGATESHSSLFISRPKSEGKERIRQLFHSMCCMTPGICVIGVFCPARSALRSRSVYGSALRRIRTSASLLLTSLVIDA